MNPKVSVIVTIYNREDFLEQCVRSLFEQTLNEVEYVFIDDASTDHSLELLKKIADKYPNKKSFIKIIELETNGGVSHARRIGMGYVSGDYVIHTDSDDWIDKDMFEKLYVKAIESGADIVGCNILHEYPNQEPSILYQHYADSIHENISRLIKGEIHPSLCTSLTRTKLITDNNILFPDGLNMGEDLLYNLQLYLHAQHIIGMDFSPYHYRHTTLSSSFQHTQETVNSGIIIGQKMEKLLKDYGKYDEFYNDITFRKFSLKLSLIYQFNNNANYQYWLKTFPETHQYIWKYKQYDWKLRLQLWLSAHKMFPLAQMIKKLLDWQHRVRNKVL